MKAYLVVEGLTDLKLLTNLLPSEIKEQVAIVPGGGRGNVTSVARTLLATRRKPVAVVTDADTNDLAVIGQRQREMEDLIRAAAAGLPFVVCLMAPEIEVLFFRVPAALERILGIKLTTDARSLAEVRPCQVLGMLGEDKPVVFQKIIDGLTEEETNVLRTTSPIRELIAFLSEATSRVLQPA